MRQWFRRRWVCQKGDTRYQMALCILVLAAISMLSCTSQQSSWDRDWLAGQPCKAPCWEGITPGMTTGAEAEAIFQQKSQVQELRVIDLSIMPSLALAWESEDRIVGGQVRYHRDSDVVYYAGFACRGECSFTLEEVIAAYGEPSHIRVTREEWSDPLGNSGTVYSLEIYYIDHGFSLDWYSELGAKPVWGYDQRFRRVSFFEPSLDGFLATVGGETSWVESFIPWQGFLSFDEYLCLANPEWCESEPSP